MFTSCDHGTAIAKVHLVHLMNLDQADRLEPQICLDMAVIRRSFRSNENLCIRLKKFTFYSVSQKNTPLRFSDIFSQTVGNF